MIRKIINESLELRVHIEQKRACLETVPLIP